ncbi:MAG: L-rhamnose mutarotase, partial [Bacteroidales bacterium]|nr:L-rhamnose mutarotase [Bacteroidales bacterium]
MKRYGQIIGVDPQQFEKYKAYHAAVWPEVLKMIELCNIRNYSIFHKDGLLFAYFEYIGTILKRHGKMQHIQNTGLVGI